MKKLLAVLPVFALLTAMMVGCGGEDDAKKEDDKSTSKTDVKTTEVSTVAYCGKCGVEAETESCCAEGAEVCADCGFHAGSTLCCTGVAVIEGTYCACGFEKGTEDCCAEDAKACADCGFHAGSTLCCKVKPADEAK